jgi:uncharacterized protein YciI
MPHFLLIYDLAPDYLDRRAEFRDAHLKLAWESSGRGELLLGGVLDDPVDQAILLFAAEDADVVEAFARNDPYAVQGLVREWHVRRWLTVAGEAAATPVRAQA